MFGFLKKKKSAEIVTAEQKEEDKDSFSTIDSTLSNVASDTVNTYGSAVKQHYVAYSGVDNENSAVLKKSLKSISKQKINPQYESQNYSQQAGFSAEVKEVANKNAENIMQRKPERYSRTDDLGNVNDPLFDIVEIDGNNQVVQGTGAQMKFVGKNANEALSKLMSKKFNKYLENNAKINVPSDYYSDILSEANARILNLKKQINNQKAKNNIEQANKLQEKVDKLNKIKKSLQCSTQSKADAMFARKHPMLSTAKSVATISHKAGVEAATNSAQFGATMSVLVNIVSVVKGEEDIEEAAKNIGQDALSAATTGYGIGVVGSTLKGAMQNASSNTLRAISNTNLPSYIAAFAITSAKTITQYASGEISTQECLLNLGEKGLSMATTGYAMTVGQAVIPIPIVGAAVGALVGSMLTSNYCNQLILMLQTKELEHQERLRIIAECEKTARRARAFREELEVYLASYFKEYRDCFDNALATINMSFQMGDAEGVIAGANQITQKLGGKVYYNNMTEFKGFLFDDSIDVL